MALSRPFVGILATSDGKPSEFPKASVLRTGGVVGQVNGGDELQLKIGTIWRGC